MSSESKNENDLKSPINGSPLLPKGNGLFYSQHDEYLYMVNDKGNIIPIQSSICGSPLVEMGDGLFFSEYDNNYYTMDETGATTPIQSPISGSPLVPKGDGVFYSEYEEEFYTLDDTGEIVPMNNEDKKVDPTSVGTNENGLKDIDNIETAIEDGRIRSSEVNVETRVVKREIQQEKIQEQDGRG